MLNFIRVTFLVLLLSLAGCGGESTSSTSEDLNTIGSEVEADANHGNELDEPDTNPSVNPGEGTDNNTDDDNDIDSTLDTDPNNNTDDDNDIDSTPDTDPNNNTDEDNDIDPTPDTDPNNNTDDDNDIDSTPDTDPNNNTDDDSNNEPVIPADAIAIYTQEDFQKMKTFNKSFILMNNVHLDLDKPISINSDFYGNGKTITVSEIPCQTHYYDNASLNSTSCGIFFSINKSLKDLNIIYNGEQIITDELPTSFSILTSNTIGGSVDNVSIKGDIDIIVSERGTLGTFSTVIMGGKVTNSSYEGNIFLKSKDTNLVIHGSVGGIAAQSSGEIINCYAKGKINAEEVQPGFIGGVTGFNTGLVANSYSLMDIDLIVNSFIEFSSSGVGGVTGGNHKLIQDSYFIGDINISSLNRIDAGGVTATNPGLIYRSFFKGNISVDTSAEGNIGGIAATSSSNGGILDTFSISNLDLKAYYARGGGITGIFFSGILQNNYHMGTINVLGSYKAYAGGIIGVTNTVNEGSIIGNIANAFNVTAYGPTAMGIGRVSGYYGRYSTYKDNLASYLLPTVGVKSEDGISTDPEDFKLQSTYESIGWDFENVWKLEGEYPELR